MVNVLITGANGFIGKNLVATLKEMNGINIMRFDIENSIDQLSAFVKEADFVFHIAGVNRPNDIGEFESGNKGFTEQLTDMLKKEGRKTPILITSSIQAILNNPYGISKRGAEDVVLRYSEETGANVFVYRLPNVFGKWCKPNYNSVVATWCHNITRNIDIQINNPDTELNLVYIDDVVRELVNALEGKVRIDENGFCFVQKVFSITLRELAETLYSFKESRETLTIPNLQGDFERYLYATYVSYLPEDGFGYELNMKHDNRGWLAEFIKSSSFGQIFISRTKPGITRGNHWHHTKVEKFLIIQGDAIVKFREINGNRVLKYTVTGDKLQVIDIPTGYTHSITNIGSVDVITLFWADEIFSSTQPDTYFLEV